jgi:alpha-1,3-fucosyltransferase
VQRWIVPIVLKASIYTDIVPPNSFIAADSFKSIKELTDYLQYLMRNTTAYIEYFQWQRTHEILEYNVLCQLCSKLLNTSEPNKVWTDLPSWYAKEGICEPGYGAKLHS